MLVVVSDLHLQHVARDGIRYVVDGTVRETGVRRNVSPDALRELLADVRAMAQQMGVRKIELVFAGDIFELLRTPLWFSGGHVGLRSTNTDLGPDSPDNPMCAKVHEVLEAIAGDNRDVWPAIGRFVHDGLVDHEHSTLALEPGTRVRVHYLPGNHDRLANAWPSVRRRVRELLAMPPSGEPFPHVSDWPAESGYGVRIRHGHEYDRSNIAVPGEAGKPIKLTDGDYLKPCFGDFVTLEVATRLSTAFRIMYAEELHAGTERGARLRAFYNALVEFDDVRPPSLLTRYLTKHLGGSAADLFELLRPVLLDVYLTAVDSPFVRTFAVKLALLRYITEPVLSLVRETIQDLSPTTLESLVRRVQQMNTSDDTEHGAASASFEEGLSEGRFDVIIAGHTHHPDQLPLPSPPGTGREMFFIDVGTWRSTIRCGIGGSFGRLRAHTVVFCFSSEEREHADGGRRFEIWTGHLAAAGFGPYDQAIGPPGPVRQRLLLRAVRVRSVEEGGTKNGAEMLLEWGVDGDRRTLRRDGVHNGDRIEYDATPIDLRPELDGELWAWGREIDLGVNSLLDSDDPLPWAMRYLERTAVGGFRGGRGELPLVGHSGTDMLLEYEIVPVDY